MKRFAQLSLAGIAAIVLMKLVGLVVVPLLGLVATALAFGFKLLLLAGAAWIVWTLLRKSGCCGVSEEE